MGNQRFYHRLTETLFIQHEKGSTLSQTSSRIFNTLHSTRHKHNSPFCPRSFLFLFYFFLFKSSSSPPSRPDAIFHARARPSVDPTIPGAARLSPDWRASLPALWKIHGDWAGGSWMFTCRSSRMSVWEGWVCERKHGTHISLRVQDNRAAWRRRGGEEERRTELSWQHQHHHHQSVSSPNIWTLDQISKYNVT